MRFLYAEDGYPHNGEYHQVQRILQIDLSPLKKHPAIEPPIYDLEYELMMAQQENDARKEALLRKKIKTVEAKWAKNYDNDFQNWTTVEELKQLMKDFRAKLLAHPDFATKLTFHRGDPNWQAYFKIGEIAPWRETLLDDVEQLLTFIEKAQQEGEQYVALVPM